VLELLGCCIITPEPVAAYSSVNTSILTNESRGAFLKLTELKIVAQPELVRTTSVIMAISFRSECGINVTIMPQGKKHNYYKEKLVIK
jgi:hypothetical protein